MVVAVTFLLEHAQAVKQLLPLPASKVLRRGAATTERGISRRVCPPVMGLAAASEKGAGGSSQPLWDSQPGKGVTLGVSRAKASALAN